MNTVNCRADANRLMDAARARAITLRKQAINDTWDGAEQAAGRALRAWRRLAQSLARHARLRNPRLGA